MASNVNTIKLQNKLFVKNILKKFVNKFATIKTIRIFTSTNHTNKNIKK